MYQGKLLMVETPEGLRRKAYGGDVVVIKSADWIKPESRKNLEARPFVRGKIRFIGDHEIEVVVDEASTAVAQLVEACKGEGIVIETVEQISPPFDDVFVKLIEKEAASDPTV